METMADLEIIVPQEMEVETLPMMPEDQEVVQVQEVVQDPEVDQVQDPEVDQVQDPEALVVHI